MGFSLTRNIFRLFLLEEAAKVEINEKEDAEILFQIRKGAKKAKKLLIMKDVAVSWVKHLVREGKIGCQ